MGNPAFFSARNGSEVLCMIAGELTYTASRIGDAFELLDTLKAEGAGEKHLPVVKINGSTVTVQVGSTLHPMTDAHSINWIYLETSKGGQFKHLDPAHEPSAEFQLTPDDKLIAVYSYCNLHGLWKSDVNEI